MQIIPPVRNPWLDISQSMGQGMVNTAQAQNMMQAQAQAQALAQRKQAMQEQLQLIQWATLMQALKEKERQQTFGQQPSPLGFISQTQKTTPTLPQGITGMENYVPPPEMKTTTETTHLPMNWEQIRQLGPSVTELIKEGQVGTAGGVPKQQIKNKTPEMLIEGALTKELGRPPTDAEIKARQLEEAEGTTYEKAMEISKRMVADAGPNAALLPGVELTTQNKYKPKPIPDISQRIPPFTPIPGMFMVNMNRKTGKYTDPTTGSDLTREQGVQRFGEGAILQADKSALSDLTKRQELIGTFVNRIDLTSNVVEQTAKTLANTDSKLLNVPMNRWKAFIGAGEWNAFNLALTSLSNEISKVESGSVGIAGASTDQMKVMAKIHDPNLSMTDLQKVIDVGRLLGKTSMDAVDKQRKELAGRFGQDVGLGGSATPSPQPTPPPPSGGLPPGVKSIRIVK